MMRDGQTIYTDQNETAALRDRFGSEAQPPECVECGAQTCYIVEKFEPLPNHRARFIKPGVQALAKFWSGFRACFDEVANVAYIPVGACDSCRGKERS